MGDYGKSKGRMTTGLRGSGSASQIVIGLQFDQKFDISFHILKNTIQTDLDAIRNRFEVDRATLRAPGLYISVVEAMTPRPCC